MRSAEAIEAWLVERLRARLGPAAEEVDAHLPFSYYGLESVDAVALAAELQQWLGRPVSPSLAWDYPTAHAVATHLGENEAAHIGRTVDGRGDAERLAELLTELEQPTSDQDDR
jgi:acyl carrier protein